MKELLRLIEGYAPGFSASIAGARRWSIGDLRRAFPAELPGAYLSFLEAMGEEGGALLAGLVDHHPSEIAALYKTAPRAMPPRRFLYLFGDPGIAPTPYFFDLEKRWGDDAEVVRMPLSLDFEGLSPESFEAKRSRRYVGLREMLAVRAMRQIVLPSFPYRAEHVPDPAAPRPEEPTRAEALASLLSRAGFTRSPLCRHCLILFREDAAAEIYRAPEGERCSIRLGGKDRLALRQVSAVIGDHTELIRWPRLAP